MTDVAAVMKALDPDLIGFDGRGNITLPRKAFETVHAAARSYVHLAEEGPDYEAAAARVYEIHGYSYLDWPPSWEAAAEKHRREARFIVDAALADYLTEGDT